MNNPFTGIFKGKVVFIGVGNPLRGDDGFGSRFIRRLEGLRNVVCFDAGSTPENYTGKIIKEKPDTIVIVDAVHLGGPAGTYQILKPDEISKSGFSTHDISLTMFVDYVKSHLRANMYLLAVQPENISFGEGLSPALENALRRIEELVKEVKHA
ncbi:MAG: hydrogenase maturation protease [Candidatus Omnitrophica bacterium]|nr:hydrogenase maturation protease [Candidatus Omnitrophota bacterium]MBD3269860.1 hydrogenase maturation protease [Candidatus Omnitrophota bacterium]